MRIIAMASGAVLVAAGIFCFANPGTPFSAFMFPLGLAMLLAGFIHTIAALFNRGDAGQHLWQLSEGLLAIILAGMLLLGCVDTEAMAILFFGMWCLFSGINRLVASFAIRKIGIKSWYWATLFACISVGIGVYSFYSSWNLGFSMALVIGGVFVIQGINGVIAGFHMKGKKKPLMMDRSEV